MCLPWGTGIDPRAKTHRVVWEGARVMRIINLLRQRWPYLLVVAAAIAFPLVVSSRYYIQVMIVAGIWAMATLSLNLILGYTCLLYTSPSPRDRTRSRMPSSA